MHLKKAPSVNWTNPIWQEHPCAARVIRLLCQFITKPKDPSPPWQETVNEPWPEPLYQLHAASSISRSHVPSRLLQSYIGSVVLLSIITDFESTPSCRTSPWKLCTAPRQVAISQSTTWGSPSTGDMGSPQHGNSSQQCENMNLV